MSRFYHCTLLRFCMMFGLSHVGHEVTAQAVDHCESYAYAFQLELSYSPVVTQPASNAVNSQFDSDWTNSCSASSSPAIDPVTGL